jgi:hypothetical protein
MLTLHVKKQTEPPAKTCKSDPRIQLVDELKVEWKNMWLEQFNDKIRAEGISVADYERLKVSRGTVLHATRSCETPEFKDILKENSVENPDRYIQPSNVEGGWKKFIKTNITNKPSKAKRADEYMSSSKPKGKQSRKSGRGWLHTA